MPVSQSFGHLEKLRDFFYGMLELRDRLRERVSPGLGHTLWMA